METATEHSKAKELRNRRAGGHSEKAAPSSQARTWNGPSCGSLAFEGRRPRLPHGNSQTHSKRQAKDPHHGHNVRRISSQNSGCTPLSAALSRGRAWPARESASNLLSRGHGKKGAPFFCWLSLKRNAYPSPPPKKKGHHWATEPRSMEQMDFPPACLPSHVRQAQSCAPRLALLTSRAGAETFGRRKVCNLVAVDSSAKSLPFCGFTGKPLDFRKKVEA